MKILLPIIFLIFGLSIFSQDKFPRSTSEERIAQILANPQCRATDRYVGYEMFLDSLKKGERGDGIHYSWMDKMRQFGIKQAHFVVYFNYKNGSYKYKVKQIDYIQGYYCSDGKKVTNKILGEIRKSGLEDELKEAIVARIKKYERPYKPDYVKSGESYHYLLDDENLPVIDYVT